MDDALLVRVLHRGADELEQVEPFVDRQAIANPTSILSDAVSVRGWRGVATAGSGRTGASAIPRGLFVGEIGVGDLRRNTTPAAPA